MAVATRISRGWARLITENLGLKLVALMLAVLLFSLVHSDVDAQRTLYVDVVALLPPPGSNRMLVSGLPDQVKITLRGSRSRLSAIGREDIPPLQMDLRDGHADYYQFEPGDVDVDGNVQVVDVDPASVTLTWADRAEKRVPVRLRVDGKLGEGLRLRDGAIIRPSSVGLRGPDSRLDEIEAVSTAVVSIDGYGTGTHTRRVPLQALPEYVSYTEDTAVDVQFVVEPEVSERTFKRLRVAAVGDARAMLRPDRVTAVVRGPRDLLGELDPEALVPYIDLDPEAPPGTRPYEVKIRGLPDGVEIVRISPASVLARVKGP
ncbi:MAG: CdaR family protein [Myxococcales bacterium]|jgi:YbbR domain-containing protein